MFILRVEHPVRRFDEWKQAFDADPVGRAAGGVRRHRVLRRVDEPDYVMIDLEFDDRSQAEAFLAGLRELWRGVDVMRDPVARVAEVVETADYRPARG